MKPHPDAVCARCGDVGKQRWITDLLRGRVSKIGVILCDKCWNALMQADGPVWAWFRKYRDELDEDK